MKLSIRTIANAIGGATLCLGVANSAFAQDQSPAAAEPAASTTAPPEPPRPVTGPSSATQTPPPPQGVTQGTLDSQVPTMTASPVSAKPLLPTWINGVTLGAGVLLWYYQPLWPRTPAVQNNVSVFWARLLIDGKWGIFSLHLEPRFRDHPLRTESATVTTADGTGASVLTYTQNNQAWLQEAYAQVDIDAIEAHLKLGKEYSHLGYFWDGSFYGNVQVYDGLKLDPDFGASLEGDVGKSEDVLSLGWWAQYFVVDGGTNVSLPNRDTISIPGGHRRNQTIARVEPRVAMGPAKVALGISGEYLQADIPLPLGSQDVWRGAVDVTATLEGLKVLGEVQHQDGRSVASFPVPYDVATGTPGSSSNVDYAQIGAEYTLGSVTARYQLSLGSYNNVPLPGGGSVTHKEWMHVPAVGVAVSPNLYVLGELVFWQHDTPGSSVMVDRSFNVTLNAHL